MRPSAQFRLHCRLLRPLVWEASQRPEDRYSVTRLRNTLSVLDAFLASTVEADIGLAFDLAIGVVVTVWVVRLTSG